MTGDWVGLARTLLILLGLLAAFVVILVWAFDEDEKARYDDLRHPKHRGGQ